MRCHLDAQQCRQGVETWQKGGDSLQAAEDTADQLNVASKTTRGPIPCHENAPHTMTDRPPAWTVPTWQAGSIASCGERHTRCLPSAMEPSVKNVICQIRSRYVTVAVSIRGDWCQMHARLSDARLSDDARLAVAHVWDDGSHTREHACSVGLSTGTRLYHGQC
ncbi:hypothetical protein JTE90_008594 [Oedothorax gibbosus]|uniref:Uncharacterized protein n=1 Tax=Oedothorax gibbosus TaxID=931172 RepID=A0AAV6U9D2_9ARAC|nr:hypothetical protein JTE90_008594 [Oedothorax gibbosus]